MKFGDSQVKSFVDKNGIISVKAPPLKPGIYMVSFSYDRKQWSNEKVVIYSLPEQSELWLLAFPGLATLGLVASLVWCAMQGLCCQQRVRVARMKEVGGSQSPVTGHARNRRL